MKTKEAYDEIFKVLRKHKDVCIFDVDDLKRRADLHLYGLELKEKYGLDIDPKRVDNPGWMRFGEYKGIGMYGEKHGRTISWSVDGRQPVDERLLQICFPTGAYIFGSSFNDDYPVELFQKFWMDLKLFGPDYVDEANHGLYWKIENAKDVFNAFDSILKKYHEINKVDAKQRAIDKLEKELKQLKA